MHTLFLSPFFLTRPENALHIQTGRKLGQTRKTLFFRTVQRRRRQYCFLLLLAQSEKKISSSSISSNQISKFSVLSQDVHFKYMKLLLMYMYRGEVSCPQEDLHGLLKTARSLQIRGLVELERKREAEGGILTNSITGSPIKQCYNSEDDDRAASTTTHSDLVGSHQQQQQHVSQQQQQHPHHHQRESHLEQRVNHQDLRRDDHVGRRDFNLDDVRSRLHGQLEIQPISQPSSTFASSDRWIDNYHHSRPTRADDVISKAVATSSNEVLDRLPGSTAHGNGSSGGEDEDHRLPHHYQVNGHNRNLNDFETRVG